MEIYESITWIAIGFVPTLLAMEIAHRFARGFKIHDRKEIAVASKTIGGYVEQ